MASPSNTSPNAPLPRNMVSFIWSRWKCLKDATSSAVGTELLQTEIFSVCYLFCILRTSHSEWLSYKLACDFDKVQTSGRRRHYIMKIEISPCWTVKGVLKRLQSDENNNKMTCCTTNFIVYRAFDVCTVTVGNSLNVASSWSADGFRTTPPPDIVTADATLCLLSVRRRHAVENKTRWENATWQSFSIRWLLT